MPKNCVTFPIGKCVLARAKLTSCAVADCDATFRLRSRKVDPLSEAVAAK
jgi:hypothetical protein